MPFSARMGDVSYRSLLLLDLSGGKFCLFDKDEALTSLRSLVVWIRA